MLYNTMRLQIKRKHYKKKLQITLYHRFRWYATLVNKTLAETFPKFPSILRVIDMSDRNPPITATSVTFCPSLRHASGLWLVDFDPTCRKHVRLTEILETFPRVFCFPKSRINENGGKKISIKISLKDIHVQCCYLACIASVPVQSKWTSCKGKFHIQAVWKMRRE